MALTLTWRKCQGAAGIADVWCSLERVDVSKIGDRGVYVIWHGGPQPKVVRIGQGNIAERITAHRNDPQVLQYKFQGELFVTWAIVASHLMDGVEHHLAGKWHPIVGDAFPVAVPIVVNSPW